MTFEWSANHQEASLHETRLSLLKLLEKRAAFGRVYKDPARAGEKSINHSTTLAAFTAFSSLLTNSPSLISLHHHVHPSRHRFHSRLRCLRRCPRQHLQLRPYPMLQRRQGCTYRVFPVTIFKINGHSLSQTGRLSRRCRPPRPPRRGSPRHERRYRYWLQPHQRHRCRKLRQLHGEHGVLRE